ncbi:MAG TPA: ankyrin repeat domain-containing protein [Burkholderiales bacterium]|nr:ankyrin repeat domain-containing protein [Burkholderiales bacterium]
MAIEMSKRTKILAGVVVLLAAAGAGAWFFLFQDEAPPPRPAAKVAEPAKGPNAAKAADAAKADAGKQGGAPQTAAAAPAAAKPAAKPIPTDPDKLIAAVIEASGLRGQMLVFSRETMLKAGGDEAAVNDILGRSLDPAKMTADIAANMKSNLDAERMARFLELLRQPVALKMAGLESGPLPADVVKDASENFRKNPPPVARVKLIQAIDEVTHASELGGELASAMARDMVDVMLDSLQKAGKKVPKEARESVAGQLNTMRSQARGNFRSLQNVIYRDVSDAELSEYLKLLDTDTGRWGSDQLAGAIKTVLVSRGSELGKAVAPLALASRGAAAAKAPEPAPEPLAKAEPQAPAEKPAASAPATPAAPVGYRRPANIRELYTSYNDVVTAAVMGDRAAVKQLLDDGKSPDARQSDGMTPLMVAVGNGDAAMAAMLLQKGADPNLRSWGGATALSIAKARGSAGAALVALLQQGGAKE